MKWSRSGKWCIIQILQRVIELFHHIEVNTKDTADAILVRTIPLMSIRRTLSASILKAIEDLEQLVTVLSRMILSSTTEEV
jgi:hypothetical protein